MRKSCAIVVAGWPGSGKSSLAKALGNQIKGVLIDKDDITAPLVSASLTAAGERADDFNCDFYKHWLSAPSYETVERAAARVAEAAVVPIIDAPYGVRAAQVGWHDQLRDRLSIESLHVIWLWAPIDQLRRRIQGRGYARDTETLRTWDHFCTFVDVGLRPDGPHLALDTSTMTEAEVLDAVLERMGNEGTQGS